MKLLATGCLVSLCVLTHAFGANTERVRGFDFVLKATDGKIVTNAPVRIDVSEFRGQNIRTDAHGRGEFRTTSRVERVSWRLIRDPSGAYPYFGRGTAEPKIVPDGNAPLIELTVAPCSTAEGRLLDLDGNPFDVEGVLVAMGGQSYPDAGEGRFGRQALTGQDGAFRFEGIPSTNHASIRVLDFHANSPKAVTVDLRTGHGRAIVPVERRYGVALSLWKRSADGQKVLWEEYDRRLLEFDREDTHSGGGSVFVKKGRVEKWGGRLPGRYVLSMPLEREDNLGIKGLTIENPVVELPSKEPEIKLVVVPKAPVPETTIEVVAADTGEPVAGALVRIRRLPGLMDLTTDDRGRAVAQLQQPTRARVEALGYLALVGQAIEPGKANRIELTPDRMIEGTVRDVGGAPLAGASARFARPQRPAWAPVRTDAQGRFLLGTYGEQEGFLIVSAPGYPRTFVPVQAREMRTRTDVRLEKGLEIRLVLRPELARALRARNARGSAKEPAALWLHLRDAETGDMAVETGVAGHEAGPFWVKPGRYDLFWMGSEFLAKLGTYDIRKPGTVNCLLTKLDDGAFRSVGEMGALFGRPYQESPEAWKRAQTWPAYLAANPEAEKTLERFGENMETWMRTPAGRRKALQWFEDHRELVNRMPSHFGMDRLEQELREGLK